MAVISIMIAALSNTLVKCGMAFVVAGLTLGKPIADRHRRHAARRSRSRASHVSKALTLGRGVGTDRLTAIRDRGKEASNERS